MDVRQLAFLARQPSAALMSRVRFRGMPKRGLALILANALFWQPLLVQAEGIVVSGPGTSLGQAGNGVPIVNIAAPNGGGLSHNQFKDYNVGANGVILNNATGRTQGTQLGGIILGNPNLKAAAAQTILNEVNGGNPSQLRGYTEVAGQSARVIVANPYGISCNGCGFINTPRVTLTTGKPMLDNGQLDRFQVDQGSVSVEGLGLDASSVDSFEIITRSAKINAQINARNLTIVAGRNDVDGQTLNPTARADDGSAKPELAIDSSALGGMYAGAIKLVGTEAGVGVKLDGTLAASGGDIQLDANGHLSMAQTSTQSNLRVNAQSVALTGKTYAAGSVEVRTPGELVNQQSLAARQQITINAGQINNPGTLEAGVELDNSRNSTGDVVLNSQTLTNNGSLLASRSLSANATQVLNNQGGVIQAPAVNLNSARLINQGAAARMFGEQSLVLGTPAIVNLGGLIRFGAGQAATLQLDTLDNREGRIEVAGGSLKLDSRELDNRAGNIIAGSLDVTTAKLANQAGLLAASLGDAQVRATEKLDNTRGQVQAASVLSVSGNELINQGGTLAANQVTVSVSSLDNRAQGLISAENGALALNVAKAFDNTQGRAQASAGLTVSAGNIANQSGILLGTDLQLISQGDLDNRKGQIVGERVTINSQGLNNSSGVLQGRELLNVTAGDLLNSDGNLIGGTLNASLASLSSNDGGVLSAETGKLTLNVQHHLNNALGRLQASLGDIDLRAASLSNQQGVIVGKKLLLIAEGGQIDNRGARIVGDQLDVQAAGLDNREAGLLAGGEQGVSLALNGPPTSQAQLLNTQGRIQSDGRLHLDAKRLDNSAGILLGRSIDITAQDLNNSNHGALVSNGGNVELSISNVLSNVTGVIDAGEHSVLLKTLTLLDNQGGTVRGKRLDIQAVTLYNNQQGQLLAGSEGLSYSGQTLQNRSGMILTSGAATELNLAQGELQNQGGTIQGDSVSLNAGRANNSADAGKAGLIASLVGDLRLTVDALTNQAGKLFAKDQVRIEGSTLDNRNAGQISGNQLNLITHGNLLNQGGLIESSSVLSLIGGSLDNSAGGQLRALAGATSTVDLTGNLNNDSGAIDIGSQAFGLKAAQLDNRAGQIQHAGAGLFSLNVTGLRGTQGSVTGLGSGQWAIGAVEGLGRLQLNDTLAYTSAQALVLNAGDRLASATGLILNVGSLSNAGELLSDGDLSLTLGGDLNNSGRLSAQRKLTVNANNLSQNGGRLASGTDTELNLRGALDNLGYLTARQHLNIAAAQINNRGTLGAQGKVSLSASNGINNAADTLLFSGSDMVLRGNSLSNLYGDIYSRGDLSFAALNGGLAQSFSNLSGTIESEGGIDLRALSVENAKAVFELSTVLTGGSLSWVCGQHCDGHDSFKRGQITIEQTFTESALKDSASARLVAGKSLLVQADNVQNRYSLMAANGNLSITANDLLNQGATTRTGRNTTVIGTPQRISTDYWDQMEFSDVPAFNAAVAAGAFDKARFEELKARSSDDRFLEQSNVTTWNDDAQPLYAATMQAGGTVTLNVARTLQNGTLHENTLAQLTGTLGDDQTGPEVGGINITLNKQATDASAQAPASVQRIESIAADGSIKLSFVPVNYSGVPFAAVDPTAAPSFHLPNGDYGLFIKSNDPKSDYLIETNPNLTNLSNFLSSDYMLGEMGYNRDDTWRRLGDGLYESRLIRDAVLARTGQRFLAGGLTSDYDQFRYLMDNALASKDALRLSVGVSLSNQQVSALTHDIVWMENRVVDGQSVLVPVLYLAQAESRNVRGSSLIQGRDLNLITGSNLINVGTLRATDNLSVSSGASVYQGGLVEAGNNLSLLAQDSIRNAMAGDIRGKQVSLSTLKGDIVNDRTAIQVRDGGGMRTLTDAGGSVSARENLVVNAGRDLTNHGALSSGGDTSLGADRDLNLVAIADVSEKHEIFNGGHRSSITTEVKNFAATVTAGGNLAMGAGRDINVVASQAKAGQNLDVGAGRDLNIVSAGDMHNVDSKSKHGKTRISESNDHTTQVASELSAGKNFNSEAGRDINVVASKLSAGNEAYLVAGNNLTLQSAENKDYSFYSKTKKTSSSKKSQLDEVTSTTSVGSLVTSGGNSILLAGNDLRINGSDIAAEKGGVILSAGNDVQIVAATDSTSARHEKSSSKSSWGGFKSSKVEDQLAETQTMAVGSVISGNTVDVTARRDATVTGSSLVSTQDLSVRAGRDLTINAAENTFNRTERHKEKNRDLSGVLTGNNLGIDDITGNQHLSISGQSHTGNAAQTTLTGSTIGSSEGNVSLAAGRDLGVIASDLVSTKNMSLSGSNVTIAAGMETASQSSVDKSNSLAVGRVIGGAIVDTAKSIQTSVKAANDADDPRLKAVKMAQAALATYNLGGMASDANDAKSGFKDKEGGTAANGSLIKIGTELANTHSKNTSQYDSQTAKQSTINAGQDLSIIASGGAAGTAGDIHIVGSDLKAANTFLLAKNNITLESAQNTVERVNDSTNNKTAIGASFNIGQQNGFTLDLGTQIAKGMGNGSSVTQVNSTLQTGSLLLRSGNDTTLAGAQVRADSIQALIDGNLNIISRQDSETQKSKQGSAGFGGSICIPPFCYGATVAASASLAAGNMNSDYQAVTDQSGLFAGTGGYDIEVGKNTVLQGAVIASEASPDKNSLSTDRLLVSDIKNASEIESRAAGLTVSYSSGYGDTPSGTTVGGGVPLALTDADHSSTRSAISEGTIVVRNAAGASDLVGLNRDTADANQTLDRPDQKAMQERIDLIQGTVELGKGLISTYASAKLEEASKQLREAKNPEEVRTAEANLNSVKKNWDVGGDDRVLADIVTGLIAGGLGGVGGGTAFGIVANTTAADTYKKLGDYADQKRDLAEKAGDRVAQSVWDEGGAARIFLHSMAGAAQGLSGGTVGASALGAGATGLTVPYMAEQILKMDLSVDVKKALIMASVGVAGASAGGVSGATSGLLEVENNYLKHTDIQLLSTMLKSCTADDTACRNNVKVEAKKFSDANDAQLMGCTDQACLDTHIAQIVEGAKSFGEIYAADQAEKAKDKLAFGAISDIETNSLLLAANLASGLASFDTWSQKNCAGGSAESCQTKFRDAVSQGTFINSQGTAGGNIATVMSGWESVFGSTKQPHEYSDVSTGCWSFNGGCGSLAQQYDALKRNAGPGGIASAEVKSGDVSELYIAGQKLGYVAHLTDPGTQSLINITLPGMHALDPGFVVRSIVPDGPDGFKIDTKGWGTGNSPAFNSNDWAAPLVWGSNAKAIWIDLKAHEKP